MRSTDGGGGPSERGPVASGQRSYLAPAWWKNWFWLGRGKASEPRGLDAAGTRREPIRKAIDQFPLISQLVSTSPLQSKSLQLSQTDGGLDGFQGLEAPTEMDPWWSGSSAASRSAAETLTAQINTS